MFVLLSESATSPFSGISRTIAGDTESIWGFYQEFLAMSQDMEKKHT